jgi:putative redox protein
VSDEKAKGGAGTGGTERERRVPSTDLYEAAKAREGDQNSGPTVLDEAATIPDRRAGDRRAASEKGDAAGAAETHASSRPSVVAARPPQLVRSRWVGEHAFEGGRDGGPTLHVDGSAPDGPSPVDALLLALGTCAGYDVVDILAKQRTPLASMDIDVLGERVDTVPRRLKRVLLTFRIAGAGIQQDQAERAVALSIDKYCSVRASLREDVAVEWRVELAD